MQTHFGCKGLNMISVSRLKQKRKIVSNLWMCLLLQL